MLAKFAAKIKSAAISLYYRIKYAEGGLTALSSLNILAKAYVAFYPVGVAFWPAMARIGSGWGFFIAAMIFSASYTVANPASRHNKGVWINREVQRTQNLNSAINRLYGHINHATLDKASGVFLMHEVLLAIQSEVEQLVRDSEKACINVTLLAEVADDQGQLEIVTRADARESARRYKKHDFLGWKAMLLKTRQYDPDFEQRGKKYRCILAIPVVDNTGRVPKSLAVISIDSVKPHHFDGRDGKIEDKILPYISLLKLILRSS